MLFQILLSGLVAHVAAQQASRSTKEAHPVLSTQKCTKSGCVPQSLKVVVDANYRSLQSASSTPCFNDASGTWNAQMCPDPESCAKNCALGGVADYGTYGIEAKDADLTLQMYPKGSGGAGSRVYLMADDDCYQLFKLKNQEFTFDVDVSSLPCGAVGALYFSNMPADGGKSQHPSNGAGAAYGTGYCDAACLKDSKFVNGEANLKWDAGTRTGSIGSCCNELDLWEGNSEATAVTAHPCKKAEQAPCDSTTSECTSACDKSGCDFNPYRMGNTTYYGPGQTVDPKAGPIRVVTQFITADNSTTGPLTEIRRLYISSEGVVQANAIPNVAGVTQNSITDTYCTQKASVFSEGGSFKSYSGMAGVDAGMDLGMVLALSTYISYDTRNVWLDSVSPQGADPSAPGNKRGPCDPTSGDAGQDKSQNPNSQVKFSNIKWGDIGTTYGTSHS